MSGILKKALSLIVGDTSGVLDLSMPKELKRPLKKLTERELIQLESEIGSTLFGDVPKGHRREFFCLDEKTWIWYEEWIDSKTRKTERMTIRYEVHENGIMKVQEGARYSYIEGEELANLVAATKMYYEQVARNVYKRDPATGQKLV
ncbi:MAG: hypothetical protein JWP06_797 [Candidatus Saccharibacteria bacterium]|nr:hypothetical protein [Candidatus Saccharibacteria bacterium]